MVAQSHGRKHTRIYPLAEARRVGVSIDLGTENLSTGRVLTGHVRGSWLGEPSRLTPNPAICVGWVHDGRSIIGRGWGSSVWPDMHLTYMIDIALTAEFVLEGGAR
jgi:hypothetical protein